MRGALGLFLLLGACAPSAWRLARQMEGKYTTGSPGQGWLVVTPGGADRAWVNDALGATIYTDSNCGPRYAETRIEDLATELVSGFRSLEDLREEYRMVGDREGILRVHQGRLDGILMRVSIVVVNKNACNYDFAFISPPENFDSGWASYEKVIQGFAETPR